MHSHFKPSFPILRIRTNQHSSSFLFNARLSSAPPQLRSDQRFCRCRRITVLFCFVRLTSLRAAATRHCDPAADACLPPPPPPSLFPLSLRIH
ncbi:hypothetical protein RIF29_39354 [Crotalaria pallida]|uniref:Uncharacterized protein n=1 Tax=Crotalaria pallida TaxID=3830 RepID=A0AAN9HPQ2_CROPI